MTRHTNSTIIDKSLRSMLAREMLAIRAQEIRSKARRRRVSLKAIKAEAYWTAVGVKTAYSHIQQLFTEMELGE